MKTNLFFKKAIIWGISISMFAVAGVSNAATKASSQVAVTTGTSATTTATPLGGAPKDINGVPPEKPDGTTPEGTPPEKPDGITPDGTPPEKPDGTQAPPDGTGAPDSNKAKVTGTSVYTLSSKAVTKTGLTYKATKKDQNAIKVTTGGNLTLSKATVTKTGDTSSEDSSNFYGLNAGILAESGGKINITSTKVSTNSDGSNAIFATGEGTSIVVSDTSIITTKDSSRGIDATYNGTITAKNVNIQTAGIHSAAIATDRGEGTITVTGGIVKTTGVDSPGIYSTGNITVSNANITATGSEAAVVEGKNSITLNNTILSGAKKSGIMLYQSFSGDAGIGTSSFKMNGGSLKAAVGPLFYITNTNSVIELSGAKLTADSGTLLSASTDKWGKTGSNGGNASFTATNETLTGNILCDSVSTISAALKNSTTLTGAIDTAHTAKSITLKLDKTSKWNVTATSYVTSLTDEDTTLSNIDDNGNIIYYDQTVSENSWLDGKTILLAEGGKLTPIK